MAHSRRGCERGHGRVGPRQPVDHGSQAQQRLAAVEQSYGCEDASRGGCPRAGSGLLPGHRPLSPRPPVPPLRADQLLPGGARGPGLWVAGHTHSRSSARQLPVLLLPTSLL